MAREELEYYEQKSYEAGQRAMKEFMERLHTAGNHKHLIEGMMDSFMRDHRTIQQETVKLFVTMLQVWGSQPQSNVSDLRNEATYEFAQTLRKDMPMFPFI